MRIVHNREIGDPGNGNGTKPACSVRLSLVLSKHYPDGQVEYLVAGVLPLGDPDLAKPLVKALISFAEDILALQAKS